MPTTSTTTTGYQPYVAPKQKKQVYKAFLPKQKGLLESQLKSMFGGSNPAGKLDFYKDVTLYGGAQSQPGAATTATTNAATTPQSSYAATGSLTNVPGQTDQIVGLNGQTQPYTTPAYSGSPDQAASNEVPLTQLLLNQANNSNYGDGQGGFASPSDYNNYTNMPLQTQAAQLSSYNNDTVSPTATVGGVGPNSPQWTPQLARYIYGGSY